MHAPERARGIGNYAHRAQHDPLRRRAGIAPIVYTYEGGKSQGESRTHTQGAAAAAAALARRFPFSFFFFIFFFF